MAINVARRKAPYKGYEKYSPYSINLRRRALGANLDDGGNVQIYRKAVPTTAAGTTAIAEKGLVVFHDAGTNSAAAAVYPNDSGIEVINKGTGAAIKIDGVSTNNTLPVVGLQVEVDNEGSGNQIAIDVDLEDEAKAYFARFDATTAWTSSKSPESDAEAGWLKIMVGSTAYFVPYYAAS